MSQAGLRRPLSILLAAERRRSTYPLISRFLSRYRSPHAGKSSSSPFSISFTFPRSFSSFIERRLLLHPHTASPPLRAALFSSASIRRQGGERPDESEVEECMIEWEEEEEAEPVLGDGGNGGGVVLGGVSWGERVLSVAREVLDLHFGEDLVMYALKVSPRGYVYVRLDKLTNKYGCPSIEEIESFNSLYKKLLDEMVESGEMPLDLALQVSSPGAERLLRVPEDMNRFKEMPMRVQYLEREEAVESKHHQQKVGVFLIESIDADAGHCTWKLADVRENRAGKGRPLNRKQRDWRLQLPFEAVKMVTLYSD
ncbi:hypothetical protein OPV22_003499 [Ensete ventricosum]|uniref:DUF7912 domain-containing protein n=1 Tax=Ensete ventricosum TaxID=4639 RepID=A0AAV8S129_ENSVE|nr:hypothetical protein OPV22_003499 [Ensete ventricosum]